MPLSYNAKTGLSFTTNDRRSNMYSYARNNDMSSFGHNQYHDYGISCDKQSDIIGESLVASGLFKK